MSVRRDKMYRWICEGCGSEYAKTWPEGWALGGWSLRNCDAAWCAQCIQSGICAHQIRSKQVVQALLDQRDQP